MVGNITIRVCMSMMRRAKMQGPVDQEGEEERTAKEREEKGRGVIWDGSRTQQTVGKAD